jgi:hypothetical protein
VEETEDGENKEGTDDDIFAENEETEEVEEVEE